MREFFKGWRRTVALVALVATTIIIGIQFSDWSAVLLLLLLSTFLILGKPGNKLLRSSPDHRRPDE